MNVDCAAVCELNCRVFVSSVAVVMNEYNAQSNYFYNAADVEIAVSTFGKINQKGDGKLSIQPPNEK